VRRALASILDQDYAGSIEVVVVFDRSEPDQSMLRDDEHRRVRVITNNRTPGLAGARNSGVLSLDTELVAFCDDDDVWLPGKARAQVATLSQRPAADFVTTGMRVDCGGRSTVRLAETSTVTMRHLVRSRMAMLHSSSFMFRRNAMLDSFGLVDETIPRSMSEDWDLLLRAARAKDIAHVDEPLVGILWSEGSYFNDAWRDKNAAGIWLLEHHPELSEDRRAAALQYSKLAFGYAAVGERRTACRYAVRALWRNWREPRTPIALAVVAGLPARRVQRELNRRGHGI
jgi:glycosyltransferase involved in cell wall biosynthesis